ncbi:MAG: hypothetical protein KAJ78_08525 [Acidobacteria bacterium]|nr:hypothetical protein [Acidobacteriota bacterium]
MMIFRHPLPGTSSVLRKNQSQRTVSNIVAAILLVLVASADGAEPMTFVVCAPGYPGSTAEAQPAMDGLAAAAAVAAGWSTEELAGVYFETEAGGIEALAKPNAAFALVTLPFFLEHREAGGLTALAQAVPSERSVSEPWTLVAGVGAIASATDLNGWELRSLAGHSPRFIRGPALGSWGELPDNLTITFSGAVLSSLRKAARGERIAVLLDAPQASALERLPFAGKLEVVHRSAPLPVSLLCAVNGRVPEGRSTELVVALRGLDARPEAAEGLAGVRIERFVAVDSEALARAETAFDGAVE